MKRKKFKKIISIAILIVLLILALCLPVYAEETKTTNGELLEDVYNEMMKNESEEFLYENDNSEIDKTTMENEKNSKIQYEKLITNIYNDDTKKYDDSYAGSYINDEGELVVKLIKSSNVDESKVRSVTENEKLILESAKYTYNELIEMNDLISSKMYQNSINDVSLTDNEKNILSLITSVGISQSQNRIIVSIKDLSEKNIQDFKKYILDSDAIIFQKGYDNNATSTTMFLGNKIVIDGKGFSIGCRAWATINDVTYYGFMTAGHNIKAYDEVKYCVGEKEYSIGKVYARKSYGTNDSAFVRITNNNFNLSNKIRNQNGVSIKTYVTSSPVEGGYVYKNGYAGGLKMGKITQTSKTVTYSNVLNSAGNPTTYTNLYEANYKTKMGDSGGPVFNKDDYDIAGIQSGVGGSPDSDGYYNCSYFGNQEYIFCTSWGGLTDAFVY